MASPSERRRNNVKAGVFVTIAILIAVGIIVVLSGIWEQLTVRTHDYTVRYPVSSGVANLKKGAEVRVGGVLLGRVASVVPRFSDGAPFEQIDVGFKINENVDLYADAKIFVTKPLLGTDAWLDISNVGDPAAGEPAGAVLDGAISTGMLNTVLGPENAARTSEIVENTREFSAFLADVPNEYDSRVVPILDDVKEATSDTRAFVKRVRNDDWPRWAGSVDQVMEWAAEFTGKLDGAVAEAHGMLIDGRGMINDNRERVDNIVVNMESASADAKEIASRVNTETVDKANRLLDTGQDALAKARDVIETVQTDYEGWSVEIGEAMGNATLASQQLKLALVEIRRSPWKLLYRPSDTEISHELLYDAARSFSLATADLKAASASVNAMLDKHGDRLVDDPELKERLTRNLLDPLENYERAQERLLDVLYQDP